MTHLSMTEGDASWGEHVTEAEYHTATSPQSLNRNARKA